MMLPKINLSLLPVKIHNLLFFGGLASALPYRTVFAKQLGISATAVGVIFLAIPFLKIITYPFFGVIFDYFKKFRLTLTIITIVVVVCHVSMVFIPPLNDSQESYLQNNFRAKLSLIPHANYSGFLLTNRTRLKLESVLKTSNVSTQISFCQMKCNSVEKKRVYQEEEKSTLCNNFISFEINVYVELQTCKITVLLKTAKLLLGNDIHDISEKDISELYLSQQGAQRNVECSPVLIKDIEFANFSKHIEKGYELQNSSLHDLDLSNSNDLNRNENVFSFTETKEYEIILKNDISQPNVATVYTENICEEYLCVVKHCYENSESLDKTDKEDFLFAQFWALFVLIATSSVTFGAVLFLIDAVCYELLSDKKEDYGKQRLWGTIGWGLGALAGGYLNDIFSFSPEDIDYAPCFYLLAILLTLDLIPLWCLNVENVKYSQNICKDVGSLLLKPDVFINIVIVFAVGILHGFLANYQFWFMEELGASQVLLGLSQTFECLAELPCFFFSGWIIKKVGYNNCNSIAFLCFGLRYLGFAYMYDPWMTLPLGLLDGPSFGLFYASMTMYGKTEAPPGTEATVQALLSTAFEGVGAGIGCVLGGIGFDTFGSRRTLFYTGIISFVLLVVNIALHATILSEESKKKRNQVELKNPLDLELK